MPTGRGERWYGSSDTAAPRARAVAMSATRGLAPPFGRSVRACLDIDALRQGPSEPCAAECCGDGGCLRALHTDCRSECESSGKLRCERACLPGAAVRLLSRRCKQAYSSSRREQQDDHQGNDEAHRDPAGSFAPFGQVPVSMQWRRRPNSCQIATYPGWPLTVGDNGWRGRSPLIDAQWRSCGCGPMQESARGAAVAVRSLG